MFLVGLDLRLALTIPSVKSDPRDYDLLHPIREVHVDLRYKVVELRYLVVSTKEEYDAHRQIVSNFRVRCIPKF